MSDKGSKVLLLQVGEICRFQSGLRPGYEKLRSAVALIQVTQMRKFRALSFGERWRVARLVATGEAPRDPRMAAAAIELAESYQRKGRAESTLYRLLAMVLIPTAVVLGVLAATDGDAAVVMAMVLVMLTNIAHLAFNPAARPQDVARSLEASRRIAAEGERS